MADDHHERRFGQDYQAQSGERMVKITTRISSELRDRLQDAKPENLTMGAWIADRLETAIAEFEETGPLEEEPPSNVIPLLGRFGHTPPETDA